MTATIFRALLFTTWVPFTAWVLVACTGPVGKTAGSEPVSASEVRGAMKKAARYFREEVATHGGYVYFYTPDLSERFGEGLATADQVWVQPPGTPTVGMAYLTAFEATGDRYYLHAAIEAAEALMYGQLKSGGWTNCIDFDPAGERVAEYRNGQGEGKNHSSLDDDQTPAALRLLMRLDKTLDFEDERLHQATILGLDSLLKAQFANGAFPQVWDGPSDQSIRPIAASYPEYDWLSEGRIKNYWDMYTLNDGLAGSVSSVLIEASQVYAGQRYEAALERLGDFLILAQMPAPQPAWAQQYNYGMHPIWARRFEPPAIASRESQDVIATLLDIYEFLGDKKYLEPVPEAIAYLESSLLPDGELARYYELQSGRPLYMKRSGQAYSLTYDDSQLPDHYGWKVASQLERLKDRYRSLKHGMATSDTQPSTTRHQVRAILSALDDHGRWITTYDGERLVGDQSFHPGDRYISSQAFAENLSQLSLYLKSLPRERP